MRLSRLVPFPLRRRLRTALLARLDPERPPLPRQQPRPAPEAPELLHVIATRHGIGVFDERWFEYRQLLLEHLPLASLEAQTRRDFLWVIGIDRAMPPKARERLERIVADRPFIRLMESELKRDFVPDLAALVQGEALARGREWALTTRLDDDDAVHRGLVARLQEESAGVLRGGRYPLAVLTPTTGCNWVPSRASGHRAYHHSPSIGLSLLEKSAGARTVYRRNHVKVAEILVPDGAGVRHLEGPTPWWLYSLTELSDQQGAGSKRKTKVADHRRARPFGESMLAQFGVTPEGARLLRTTPEPEPRESLYYLTRRGHEVEEEIHGLRASLEERGADAAEVRSRIAELHAERRRMHEDLVR